MEDDFIRNTLSPAADQEVESSWSGSNSVDSGVTTDGSRYRSCESCGNANTRLEECTVWTDEKHNLYLDYLETSFVRQLYRLLGGKTDKSLRSDDPPANSYESTDQKINFGKKWTHLEASSNSYPRESPFTIDFTHPNTIGAAVQGTLSPSDEIDCYINKASPRTSMRNPVGKLEYLLCHERSKGSTAESSGQNFTDKDKEENSSSSPVPKRHKRDTEIDGSISDKVVPLGKVNQRDVPSANEVVFFGTPTELQLSKDERSPLFYRRKLSLKIKNPTSVGDIGVNLSSME